MIPNAVSSEGPSTITSTEEEKENDAYAFAKKYRNDLDGFVEFICASEFSLSVSQFSNVC